MATPLDPAILQESVAALAQHNGHKAKAAAFLHLPINTFKSRLDQAVRHGIELPQFEHGQLVVGHHDFTYTPLPDPDLSVDELIDHRIKQFEKKRDYEEARKLIPVHVHLEGPIGVWHFGDPHLDDDGTDLSLVREHVGIVNATAGLFGANVGDSSNNWVGRLAHLWSQQGTTARQAWQLVEWFITSTPWLYLIGGNHDAWSGEGDPIKWMMHGQTAPYESSEVRLDLRFPNGNNCRINARHDFSGHSQYNPAHGPMKANLFGVRDHIAIAGHKHISASGELKNPDDGSICHALLVAGYKIYDRYARDRGFRDQRFSPGVLTIINVDLPNTHPDYITKFWDLEHGVNYLNYLRKPYNKKKK